MEEENDAMSGLNSHYDCVVIGTRSSLYLSLSLLIARSLVQAILSSALSKVGKKVLHLDQVSCRSFSSSPQPE
jgi:RAB protein geranylgeranyltransferase component A